MPSFFRRGRALDCRVHAKVWTQDATREIKALCSRIRFCRVYWVHRNKGTWRDMRSASIIFVRSLLLTGDSTGGFPATFALSGSACARINMLDRFDLPDEKLRDALESSAEVAS